MTDLLRKKEVEEESISICMITCWYYDISMASYSKNIINALSKKHMNLKVLTSQCICGNKYTDAPCRFYDNCQVVTNFFDRITFGKGIFRKWMGNLGRSLLGLQYYIRSRGCDIVHYQESNDYSFGWFPLIALVLLPSKSKKIVTIHSIDSITKKYRKLNGLYQMVDALIVHTELQKRQMIDLGLPGTKIHVIFHGGVPVPNLHKERTRISFFGSPEIERGFFVILESLNLLAKEGIRLNLDVYGIYQAEKEVIAKQKAEELGVADLVRWHGRVTESEFDEKMQESMFTFAIYQNPVWGSSIITRAMMNGTPVITTPVGGSSEYLGDAGIYVPFGDTQALSLAIQQMVSNPELRKEKGRRIRDRAVRYLTWTSIADQTQALYRSVLYKQQIPTG